MDRPSGESACFQLYGVRTFKHSMRYDTAGGISRIRTPSSAFEHTYDAFRPLFGILVYLPVLFPYFINDRYSKNRKKGL